jgi:CheY-like chemotaxis protein
MKNSAKNKSGGGLLGILLGGGVYQLQQNWLSSLSAEILQSSHNKILKESLSSSDKDVSNPTFESSSKVLILEDERLIAESIRILLESNGYSVVDIVASGEEAIKKADLHNPDLLLMDIRLAGELDGIETAVMIHSKKQKIPIVFLTAHPQDRFPHINQLDPSTFVYLRKPYSDADLLHAIDEVIGKENK